MNKTSLCLFGGALLGAGLSGVASADITINDSIDMLGSPIAGYDLGAFAYAYGNLEIDRIDFTVASDGEVSLDMLSYQVFDSWIDPIIILFNNDGQELSMSNYVGFSDDSEDPDFNGSLGTFDSLLTIFLSAGDYTVTVGGWDYGIAEASAGSNLATVVDNGGNGLPTSGAYQLDIIGDVSLTVPTPGSLAILGLGGFVGARRRR